MRAKSMASLARIGSDSNVDSLTSRQRYSPSTTSLMSTSKRISPCCFTTVVSTSGSRRSVRFFGFSRSPN